MKSKHEEPSAGDAERRRLISTRLLGIAKPEAAAWATREDWEHVASLFAEFGQLCPPLESKDVAGLVVLRLVSEFWVPGRLDQLDVDLATLQGLGLACAVAPERMRSAQLCGPAILHPAAKPAVMLHYGLAVQASWQEWYRRTLSPYGDPPSERHEIARGVARLRCLRPVAGEVASMRSAKAKLDAYFGRKGWGRSLLESEDLMAEMQAFEPRVMGKKKLLRLRFDGFMAYDERRVRDAFRERRYASGALGVPADDLEVEEHGSSLWQRLDDAALLDELLRQCDAIDRAIISHWGDSDVELAGTLGISPPAVGKRRRKIRDRAERSDRSNRA